MRTPSSVLLGPSAQDTPLFLPLGTENLAISLLAERALLYRDRSRLVQRDAEYLDCSLSIFSTGYHSLAPSWEKELSYRPLRDPDNAVQRSGPRRAR